MVTLSFFVACSHAKLNKCGTVFTLRLVFLQFSVSSRTSSSMSTPTAFFTEYKRSTCFEENFVWVFILYVGLVFLQTTFKKCLYQIALSTHQCIRVNTTQTCETTVFHQSSIFVLEGCKILKFATIIRTVRDTVYEKGLSSQLYRQKKIKASYRTSSKFISKAA